MHSEPKRGEFLLLTITIIIISSSTAASIQLGMKPNFVTTLFCPIFFHWSTTEIQTSPASLLALHESGKRQAQKPIHVSTGHYKNQRKLTIPSTPRHLSGRSIIRRKVHLTTHNLPTLAYEDKRVKIVEEVHESSKHLSRCREILV
ncbi:hypothetical protein CPB85DRAFT_1331996 [Mucidula mucida]|nr:hypothetical protein CPB85DRAFT_1331996 [Mucidula mucida]